MRTQTGGHKFVDRLNLREGKSGHKQNTIMVKVASFIGTRSRILDLNPASNRNMTEKLLKEFVMLVSRRGANVHRRVIRIQPQKQGFKTGQFEF